MPFQSLRCLFSRETIEAASSLLLEVGALSITYTDAHDEPLLEPDPESMPLWKEAYLTALFDADEALEPIIALLQTQFEEAQQIEVEIIPDQAWERIALQDFTPMEFGQHLRIVPTWHWDQIHKPYEIVLDPGLAFGTGTHPTTRLMLEYLDTHDCTAQTVIDYGCGSGILAIAAVKMGAEQVWAIDHDPQALLATDSNALQNGCADRIKTMLSESNIVQTADLILANIILEVLLSLKPRFAAHLKPQGILVLSGILETQIDSIKTAYLDQFDLLSVNTCEGWARVVLQFTSSMHSA